jgi:hypothetical protein
MGGVSKLKSLQLVAGFLKDVGAWMSGFTTLSIVTSEFGDLDPKIVYYLTLSLCGFALSAVLSLAGISLAAGFHNPKPNRHGTATCSGWASILIVIASLCSLVGLCLILTCFGLALTKQRVYNPPS